MTSHIFSQFDYWKECAEEGNTQAQYNLGEIYYHGEEVKQDYSEALKWFRKAAEDGLAKAQFMLGVMYENGLGVEKNYMAAFSWYLKAAEQGHTEAEKCCEKLAEAEYITADVQNRMKDLLYKHKRLAEKERKLADARRKRAEELYYRGLSYYIGEGVKQNYSEAIKYFNMAASLGHPEAKQKLVDEQQKLDKRTKVRQRRAEELYYRGLIYYIGEGVKQNYSEAIKYFNMAASLGHPEAKQKLAKAQRKLSKGAKQQGRAEELYCNGLLYYMGEGVKQDYNKAIQYFCMAARLGHSDAQNTLNQLGETW